MLRKARTYQNDPPATRHHELQTLERRLEEGYARIEEAIARGEDVRAWESFWIDLLHQYEAMSDELGVTDARV